MTGVQYVKNDKGETTFLMVDYKLHHEAIKTFLEDLADVEAMKKVQDEELISFDEVRSHLIEKARVSNSQF